MAYKDLEKRKAKDRRYYLRNTEIIKRRTSDYYHARSEAISVRRQELHTPERKREIAELVKRGHYQKRLKIIEYYGGKCSCCGESEPLFLEIDHINNDGKEHRNRIGGGGRSIILWIIKNNFPDTVQLLCSNCNQGKRRNNGICPHKTGGKS